MKLLKPLRIVLPALLLGLLPLLVAAQEVVFCEQVSADGKPVNASDYFSIKRDGGFLHVLVTLQQPVNTDQVRADLFRREKGKSIFESSVFIATAPSYRWFAHRLTFFREGEYEIFFYDKQEKLIAVGGIRLQVR
jgi:hypothetical protein